MEFVQDYWGDQAAKESFIDFMMKIYGLDFSKWETAGYWDDNYRPFSFFQDGEILSSICFYSIKASFLHEGRVPN